jgi:hypothetical protein
MAELHRTTMSPSKIELLTDWLPDQAWYPGRSTPRLSKAGGFRLDDPAGQVGIEFLVVADPVGIDGMAGDVRLADAGTAGGNLDPGYAAYLVPLAYRDAPFSGGEQALIGTSEHGVLGRRWVYDGVHDPVVVRTLFALLTGSAEPQSQDVSNTPDPSVIVRIGELEGFAVSEFAVGDSNSNATEVLVNALHPGTSATRSVRLQVARALSDNPDDEAYRYAVGSVTGGWVLPDGTAKRGSFVTAG